MAERYTASTAALSPGAASADRGGLSRSDLRRIVGAVAKVLRTVLDDRTDEAFPDRIAALVERLHQGPLGRAGRNPHRAAA